MGWKVVLLLAGLLVAAACGKSPEQRLADHTERAGRFLEEGKVDEAIVELRSALQLAPNEAKALFQLGHAHLRKGDVKEAYRAFTRVSELDPTNLDVQLRIGELYLLANSPAESRERAERVLADAPERADAHVLLGKVLLREGKNDDAVKEFERAMVLEPGNLEHAVAKASALLLAGRLPESRDALESILETDGSHAEALLLLAQVADLQGDRQLTDRMFGRLLDASPKSPTVWLSYGNYWAKKGEFRKALEAYRKLGEMEKKTTRGWEKAAELAIANNEREEARKAVGDIFSRNPKSLAGTYLDAKVLMMEGKFEEATSRFREVLNQDPNSAEAHYFLGLSYRAQRKPLLAKTALQKAVDVDPGNFKAKVLLAQVYADTRDFDAALELTGDLLEKHRVHSEVLYIRGTALLGKGDIPGARKVFEALTKAMPTHAGAQQGLGYCYMQERKSGKALEAFRRALDADPKDLIPLVFSTYLLVAEGRARDAFEMVDAHVRKEGDSAGARLIRARLYIQQRDAEHARRELDRAIELNPNSVEAYLVLAELHSGPEALTGALADIERGLAKAPAYAPGWMLKGMIQDRLGRPSEAEQSYRKAVELRQDFAPALNNLAWNLAEGGGNIDEALRFAERAVELAPDSGAANDTLGWIYSKKGVYLKAVSHLELAVQALPTQPSVHYHLGMAYAGLREKEKAVALLQKALKLSDRFSGVEEARKTLEQLGAKL